MNNPNEQSVGLMPSNHGERKGVVCSAGVRLRRMTWRAYRPKGRYRVKKSYELWRGDDHLATAAEHTSGGLWYWYGDGVNTAHRPAKFEDVKKEAEAHFRSLPNNQDLTDAESQSTKPTR